MGSFLFVVLVNERVVTYIIFSLGISIGSLLFCPISNIEYFNIGSILYVKTSDQFDFLETRSSQIHNFKFVKEKVNLIH